jgi:hypothetical protein
MSQLMDPILHAPWWVAAMLAAAGVAMFVWGDRRLDKALKRVGIALVLVAVVLAILHAMFPSQRERAEKRTRQIVRAIDQKDWNALRSLLDANTTLGTNSHLLASGGEAIVSLTKSATETFGVKSLWISGISSRQTDALITVSAEVISNQDASLDRPVASGAQLDFQQYGDDWILEKITILRVQDQTDPSFNLMR